jgi:subtilisin-like proprotein convertase family protein
MKLRSLHAFLPLALLSLSQPARALTSETYNYGFGSVPIPDGNPAGFANAQTIASSINVITKLTVQLNLSSGYNGDLYAYLRHTTPGGTGFSVLLNRVGSTSSNSFGYSDAGFDVTLADAAANGDVHVYQGTLDPAGSALTGTWAPDGRNIDPDLSLDTTTRTALLGSFNGLSALGEWTLFLADVSGGAVSNLNSWGMTIDGLSGSFYWKGGNGGVWNAVSAGSSNWAADAAGTTPILAVPDPNADVIFSANGATDLNTILGADLTIRSLTVNDSAAVTIGGPNTLTISGPAGRKSATEC